MATKNENLARVGSAMQIAAMLVAMIDANTSGADDKLAGVIRKLGEGFVKASAGDLKSGAGLIDAAADALKDLAAELRAGKES